MDKVIFTRQELYNLVWKFSIYQISKHYEISTMSIKNACEKMQIPLPGTKHWIKFKYNSSKVPRLSQDYKGSNQIKIFRKTYESQLRKTSKSTPLAQLIKSIQGDSGAPLQVLKTLTDPSTIIQEAQIQFATQKLNKKVVINQVKVLNLNVTKKNIPRALRFMDAFIKLLEYRGHQFEKGADGTGFIRMNGEIEIDIYLREALKRIPPKRNDDMSEYVYTGEFILQIRKDSYKKEWRDGKISLENSLVPIVAKLEIIAAEEKQWKEDSEIQKFK
ncbi:hypothetical protein L1276_000380 [Flavobacterium sp. HSC-32F16]|uniref:hypothetical protein n=1 Tax=Flavobacterium sp. HSC-32F16 TaxID=2910964 RepID=UPI0020A5FCB3|nr:hypothetical protein [Flavobacterium sp. HSC-32F16]MCP2025240.1 hypothetical protein [Flavobacterium sp. HSC-32F16]